MSLSTEALFTAALGLQAPWRVERAELSTAKRRIDFDVICTERRMTCPHCGTVDQGIHERVSRSWRHLDFFQFEAWLHADIPRVACSACGKTSQVPVPWAREGSGFTLLFEALALSLCKELPVAHAARHLRADAKALWRRIEHYIQVAREQDDMSGVRHIGIDETSVRKGHEYVTVVHDLQQKRLLFATEGRDHQTVQAFAKDLAEHGGSVQDIGHVSMDMSAAYLKGAQQQLPKAAICYDRFHVAALAGKAMDEVRVAEFKARPGAVATALGELDSPSRRSLSWAMRTHHAGWSERHMQAMYALQRTNLQSARAWRLKVALREVYEAAAQSQDTQVARTGLERWIGWAMRSRLEPFKRLARTLRTHFEGVISGMQQGRSNAFVEAMNGLMQNAKRAARGFRTSKNFIAVAYLRLSKLKHLPANPFEHAAPRFAGLTTHWC
ncbi:ISL3 family transposase [Microcoleus sp. herbarium19]|uniref:ISL3 family transposase n=1 Tax=Microcoleus sp. herbarium19 TaxID=3055440 RepID=UPI002FD52AF9